MPQSRFRNEMSYGEDTPRSTYASRASGDSTSCAIKQHQNNLARSQDKLPRSVRYELENALVSLCDVWFDEIKPHLVRNNIKLHIHGGGSCSASGDQGSAASTTHERREPPAPPPPPSPLSDACSHLDPGAARDRPRRVVSCANSWSPLPAVSSALRVRLRTKLPCPLSPVISMPQTPRDGPQIPTHNCEKKRERPGIRRKRRRFRAQAQPSWRVPRLCRTHPALCSAGAAGTATMSASQLQPPPCDNYYRFIVPRRESVMKNKTTQTEPALKVSRGCQSHSPSTRSPGLRSSGPRRPGLHSPGPLSPGLHSPGPLTPGPRSPTSRRPGLRSPGPHSPAPRSPTHIGHAPRNSKRSPISCSPDSSSRDRALSPLNLPPPIICQLKRSDVTVAGLPPLLQDDLIDIIAASNEKRLRLLYSSSERDDNPSFLNLFPCRPEKQSLKKLPPWR